MSFENDEKQSFINNPMSWENNVTDVQSRLNVGPNAYIVRQDSIPESHNNQSTSNAISEQESGMQSTSNIMQENIQSENSRPESTENSVSCPSTTTSDKASITIDVASSNPNPDQTNTPSAESNEHQSRLNDTKTFPPFITRREPVSKYSKTPSDQMIIFSDKAYNAIISEAFAKHPVETGGILIGHVLNNGFWIVTEVIPPGKSSINEYAYFEYDTSFVNYVANRVALQFEIPPRVLGLWHRHPGSMDYFSSTDDGTNKTFAALDRSHGAVSALVNIDPNFRITIYHATLNPHTGVRYETMPYEVGDELIPEEYFKLKYFPKFGKNPSLPNRHRPQATPIQQRPQTTVTNFGTCDQTSDSEDRNPFLAGNRSESDSDSVPESSLQRLLTFITIVALALCLILCVQTVQQYYQCIHKPIYTPYDSQIGPSRSTVKSSDRTTVYHLQSRPSTPIQQFDRPVEQKNLQPRQNDSGSQQINVTESSTVTNKDLTESNWQNVTNTTPRAYGVQDSVSDETKSFYDQK